MNTLLVRVLPVKTIEVITPRLEHPLFSRMPAISRDVPLTGGHQFLLVSFDVLALTLLVEKREEVYGRHPLEPIGN